MSLFHQAHCQIAPESLFCQSLVAGGAIVDLYKISGGECGQAEIAAKYEKPAEAFAGLKEGTCASQGYTHSDGSKEINVPVIGDIKIQTFSKPTRDGETEVDLYKIANGYCGQAELAAKYEKPAEEFAGLKEGTCAAQGYTHSEGERDIHVPVLGDIKIETYSKPAFDGITEVDLYKIANGFCGQAEIDARYEKPAEAFAGLKEGTCASQGYTHPEGEKDINVPVIGDIKIETYSKPALVETVVDLYKIANGFCGQAELAAKYEKPAEEFAGLQEGTCASQGYTHSEGTKDIQVPILGDIKIQTYSKPSLEGDAVVDLYKISGGECGQAEIAAKYEKPAEAFAGLKEGTCASQGYTHSDGSKEINVPVIGDIKIQTFSKPAESIIERFNQITGFHLHPVQQMI